jgi:hypothetical protein
VAAAAGAARICGVSEERLAFPRPELRRRTARGAILNGLFLGACALFTWLVERPLLREAARESRSPRLTAEAVAPATVEAGAR